MPINHAIMKRLLLIVDPQIDFISGTLPVPGAAEKMEALANYIRETDREYEFKVVTTDWHPYQHCSFTENGGEWPMHCVQNTAGAAICQTLIKPLFTTKGEVTVLRKGTSEDADEYSIFKNALSAEKLDRLIRGNGIERIDICGIAGDVCVLNTFRDGIERYEAAMFRVLTEFCPSLDGGTALAEAIGATGCESSGGNQM